MRRRKLGLTSWRSVLDFIQLRALKGFLMLSDGRLILLCQKGLQGLIGNPGWSLSTFDALNELFATASPDDWSAIILLWRYFPPFRVDLPLPLPVIAILFLLPDSACHVVSRRCIGSVLLVLVEGQEYEGAAYSGDV
jgi:hypothetical protein